MNLTDTIGVWKKSSEDKLASVSLGFCFESFWINGFGTLLQWVVLDGLEPFFNFAKY